MTRGTIEEFVRTVLETKARIVDDLVEGKALGADLDTDVLTELRRMIRLIDRQFEHVDKQAATQEERTEILRAAGEAYLGDQEERMGSATRNALVPVSAGAIRALAQVLQGPRRACYRIASSRDDSVHYILEVVGGDITCDCKGFSYRSLQSRPDLEGQAGVSECPDCGGRMKIIAALTEPASIRSYLEGVGLSARPQLEFAA